MEDVRRALAQAQARVEELERALERARARELAWLSSVPGVMLRYDPDGTILSCIDPIGGLVEPPTSWRGSSIHDRLPPPTARLLQSGIDEALETGEPTERFFQVEHPDAPEGLDIHWRGQAFEGCVLATTLATPRTPEGGFPSDGELRRFLRLENTRLRRIVAREGLLHTISTRLLNLPLDEALQQVLEMLSAQSLITAAWLALPDGEESTLRVVSRDATRVRRIPRALRALLADGPIEGVSEARPVWRALLGADSVLCVSLGQGLGVLGLVGLDEHLWTEEERLTLSLVGDLIAMGLARAESEREHRAHSALLEAILNTAPLTVSYLDRDMVFRVFSAERSRDFFPAQDGLLGRSLHEIVPEEMLPSVLEVTEAGLRGEAQRFHVDLSDQLGERLVYYVMSTPHRAVDGEVQGLISVLVDVTERVQAEEALQTQERLLRTILNTAPMSIIYFDTDGRYQIVNDEALRGLEPGQVIGKHIEDVVGVPELRDSFQKCVDRALAGHPITMSNETMIPWLGETRTYYAIFTPQRGQDETVEGVVFVALDVTEQERTRERLRVSEERLTQALEGSNHGLWDWDVRSDTMYMSPRIWTMLGRDPEEMPATLDGYRSFVHPEDVSMIERIASKHLVGTATTPYEAEMRMLTEDGSWKWILSRGSVTERDARGRALRMVGTQTDLTERKRVEAEMRQARDVAERASRAKSEFLANVSHELRTPLNGILGYAQILRKDPALHDRQRARVEIIQRSGEHLMRLINEVLDLSRIEAQRMELAPSVFDLRVLLDGLVALCRPRASQKGLALRERIAPDVPRGVRADAQRLRQVVLNLLSNAIKFTREGLVEFLVSREGDWVCFEVRDTGVGIAPEAQEFIFEPFRQLGRASTKAEGSGLGLAISRELVHLMGGELEVHSVVGEGSVFRFSLRLPEVHEVPLEQVQEELIVGYTGARQRALVVDDHPDNRAVLVELLEPLGLEMHEAEDGPQALTLAGSLRPRIIFMDLRMPGMGGVEVIRALRETPHGAEPTIITVSASALGPGAEDSLRAGADAFLSKPFNTHQLHRVLLDHVSLSWLEREDSDAEESSLAEESEAERPPAEELLMLRDLLLSGDVLAITSWAEGEGAARWPEFARHVQELARGFQLRALRALIAPEEEL